MCVLEEQDAEETAELGEGLGEGGSPRMRIKPKAIRNSPEELPKSPWLRLQKSWLPIFLVSSTNFLVKEKRGLKAPFLGEIHWRVLV